MKANVQRMLTLVLILSILAVSSFTYATEDTGLTTTGMRMQPLKDKLATLTQADINEELNKYGDMKIHWSRGVVGEASVLGLVMGSGGRFKPENKVTVAEFLAFVTRSLGYKIADTIGKGTHWYDGIVKQALADKLVNKGEYKAYTAYMTREQASKIILRAAALKEPVPNEEGPFNVMRCRIKDYAQIGNAYKDCFVRTYMMGYFTLDKLAVCNPKNNLTRAQACVLTTKLVDDAMKGKFEVQEDEYYTDQNGEKYYPRLGSFENVKAINFMKKAMAKSKGYVDWGANENGMSIQFYESKEEYERNSTTGFNMAVTISNDTRDPYSTNAPFTIQTFNTKSAYSLNRDVLVELFKYLFEFDKDKALKDMDALFNLAFNELGKEQFKQYKYVDRYMATGKVSNSQQVRIEITSKGGKSILG